MENTVTHDRWVVKKLALGQGDDNLRSGKGKKSEGKKKGRNKKGQNVGPVASGRRSKKRETI